MSNQICESILVVDDEQRLLDALYRRHRKTFHLRMACGAEAGLEAIERDGPFAVVVSDFQMPGMNGIAFLSRIKKVSPDTVRLMLSGNADFRTAIDAVNRGEIFRFLTKPCGDEVFAAGLNLALEQYRLVQSERILLEETLRGSIQVLAEVLSLANPLAFGRAQRLQDYVRQVVESMGLEEGWRYETAALLSQIGSVGTPPEVLAAAAGGEELTTEQREIIERQPSLASELLAHIPRLEGVAAMIAAQSPQAVAETEQDPDLQLGARILAAVLAFDELVSCGATRAQAVRTLQEGGQHTTKLLQCLRELDLPGQDAVVQVLGVPELRIGMILEQDVTNATGGLLVPKGQMITQGMLARLRNYAQLGSLPGTLRVRVAPSRARFEPTRVS